MLNVLRQTTGIHITSSTSINLRVTLPSSIFADDDSSFLLRASSRRLTPLGVTRNSRDHSQSFINFLATYQEPILHPKSKRYKGGRFIRQVKIQFFPSDRTATVGYMKEDSRTLSSLDGAKSQSLSSSPSWLSDKSTAHARRKRQCSYGLHDSIIDGFR